MRERKEGKKRGEGQGKEGGRGKKRRLLVSFLCEVYNTNTKHCTEGPQEMFPQKNQQNSTGESRTNGHILCGKGTSH